MQRLRTVSASAIAAALMASSPAAADEEWEHWPPGQWRENGCTVTAQAPYPSGSANGQTIARFQVDFKCAGGRSILIRQRIYDMDTGENSADDLLSERDFGPYNVPASGGSGYVFRTILVDYWDGGGDPWVELKQEMRFRVCGNGANGICGWAPIDSWVSSPIVKFFV